MSKIKYIVNVLSSTHDRNGNRSHCATITSTKTAKRLAIRDLGGPNNVRSGLRRVMGGDFDIDFPAVYTIHQEMIPRREFARRERSQRGMYENHVTREVIEALDKED